MRKVLVSVLLLAVALTVFAGCSEEGESSDLNLYSEASYDNESKFIPSEESKEASSSESNASGEENTPLSGEFVVKDKKYTFEGNDLVIVSVENQTNKNYSVTVTGTYLDKDGNVLKTETQTFNQYSAGYSNRFLFYPAMPFDKFTYTVTTEEIERPFYAKNVTYQFNGLQLIYTQIREEMLKDNWTKYPTVLAAIAHGSNEDVMIKVSSDWVLINENDEVVGIVGHTVFVEPGQRCDSGASNHIILYQTKDQEYTMPQKWSGQIRAIVIITDVIQEDIPAPPPV